MWYETMVDGVGNASSGGLMKIDIFAWNFFYNF